MNDGFVKFFRQVFGVDENLKILAVSSEGAMAYAVYDGENLVMTHSLMVPGGLENPRIINEVINKRSQGFLCVVEGRSAQLDGHAIQFPLDDLSQSDPLLIHVLLWYISMLKSERILFSPECQQFIIELYKKDIRTDRDAEGRLLCLIDWRALSAEQRALLVCLVGILSELTRERGFDEVISKIAEDGNDLSMLREILHRWPHKLASIEPH